MGTIDNVIVFVYLGAMLAIGLYASRRQKDVDDYYVAGRRQGTFSIMCLWLASWIGGASIVGSSAKAYTHGITGVWYVSALAIGCLLFGLIFAARVKRLGDSERHLTYPDVIEQRYDHRTRLVATITTAAAFIAFAAGQLAAAGSLIHVLLGWDFAPSLLLAGGIVIVYTATGGYLAVTYTDWVQFVLLVVGIVFIGLPIAVSQTGSLETLAQTLPDSYFELGAWGNAAILALLVSIALSFFTAMDSFTRSYAARDVKAARRGCILAAFAMVPIAVAATWLGLASAVLFPGLENPNDVLTHFVVQLFPAGLKGLALVGILAAIMSTADICILTASANLTRDVYQRHFRPDFGQKEMLRISTLSSLVVGFVAILLAWKMQDVLEILLLAFTLNSAALFLPTVAAVYALRVNPSAAFWSISLSLATVLAWYAGAALHLASWFEVEPLWPGLAVSAVSFTGLNWLARRRRSVHEPQPL